MSVTPITPAAVPPTPPPAVSGAGKQPAGGPSFSQLVSQVMQEANLEQQQADAALQGLATGKVENIHDVVLAVAKADLSFRFLLEVRNKLTEAYQEISRMQF